MRATPSVYGALAARLALLVAACLIAESSAFAANYFSRQTGNWNVNTTWSTACGGAAVGVGVFPVAGDAVQICNLAAAHTVTVTAAATAASIAINSGNQNSTLAISGGVTLTITGNAIATGNTNLVNKLFSVGAGATFAVGGNLALVTGNQTKNAELRLADGATTTVTVGGFFAGTAVGGAFSPRALITFLGQGTLNVGGKLESGATLAGGTGTINFNGGAAQTIGTYTTYNNIRINNTAGGVTLTGTTTFGGTLQVQTGTFTVGAFALTVTGATNVASTMALTSDTGAKNLNGTVTVQNGGILDLQASSPTFANTVTVQNGGTLQLTTSVTGTKTFNGTVVIDTGGIWNNTINEGVSFNNSVTNNGTFTTGNGAHVLAGSLINSNVFNAGTGTFSLTGNFTNNGTFNSSTGTFTFNGGAAQTIGGTSGATSFANLTLANANGLSLTGTHNVTVSTLLTLTTGSITTGANVLFISNGSDIASAGGTDFIIGNLMKAVATGAPTTIFEIGTGTSYTPVTLVFASVTTAGNLTATTTTTDHPDVANSGLNSALSVNRYWTFTNSGVVFTTYDATFTFVAGDLDGGADTTIFEVSRFSPPTPAAGSWSSQTVGTRTATTTQITGATGFGDFAIGQPSAAAGGIGRFNAYDTTTAAGAVTGKITTKVAGAAFNVDVIAIVTNRKSINTNFTGTVRVELLNASDSSGTLDTATGCITSWTVIQTISPDPVFVGADNGRITISVTENNSWREARFRIQNFPAATLTGCSTDAFAIRPASFSVSVTDDTWDTAGLTRALDNTGNVHKAGTGRPFTITVTPAPVSAANYDGTLATSALACTPATCTTGTLTLGTFSGSGTRTSSAATYTEAGVFNLTLVDTSFAVIDATDGTPADCTASGRYVCQSPAPLAVGRFVPDRFEFASPSTPNLLTFNSATCGTRSFTYIGQPFWYVTGMLPSATLNAVNADGAVTTNYPLNTATSRPVIGENYADGTAPVTLVTTAVGTPQATSGSGTGTYAAATAISGAQLSYTRSTSTPTAPFTSAISLTVSASDSTEAAVPGNGTITTPTPLVFNGSGSGIAFDSGAQFRYGRLGIRNASGSQLVPLPVLMETQYASYTNPPTNTILGFITNIADSCTSIAASTLASNVAMSGFTSNLTESPCDTALSGGGTFSSGRKTLLLAAPGSGNNGSVNLTVNLGSGAALGTTCRSVNPAVPVADSGANLLFLQGNWTGANYDQNPLGRATFGVYRGSDEVIFIRENLE